MLSGYLQILSCWLTSEAVMSFLACCQHLKTVHQMQEPLLFSRCVYKNIRMRVSDRSRLQTLQIIEHAADQHRIGSSMYMHLAEKLKSDTYNVHQTVNNERHSHGITAALHVNMLKREKEPDIAERLHAWSEIQSERL
jgi:hypothetical protein